MESFKRLLMLARPYSVRMGFAMICMLIVGATTSSQAVLVKPVLDDIFLAKNPASLKWIPFAVIGIFLIKGSCNYAQTILMSFIGLRIVTDLRNKLYDQIQKQSLAFFTQHPTGILMSRITNDVMAIQTASSEVITSIVKDTFTLIALVGVIFYTDWQLAIIAMIVFPVTIYPITRLGRKMRTVTTSTQITMGTLSSLLQETISGTRIVKAFCMEKYESNRFATENERLFKLNLKSVSVIAISHPLMEFLGGLGIAAVIFYGGYNVLEGNSTPGTFFSFLAAAADAL